MKGRTVVCTTQSEAEAALVAGLLEAEGLSPTIERSPLRSVFPVPIAFFGQLRVTVPDEEADDATRLLRRFETVPSSGPKVVPLHDDLAPLEAAIGYRFRDRGPLEQALTHRSRAHEDGTGPESTNESLEFLGDAVLGFVIADLVFEEYPQSDEGQKSKIKASLVSYTALARVAESIALGQHLRLGRGEEKTGGRHKPVLLADACEALIAAVYLDGGLAAARALILRLLAPLLEETRARGLAVAGAGDFKSSLQEYLQARRQSPPAYRIVEQSGPDHDKVFTVDVAAAGKVLAQASGRSRKEAEQQAARRALEALRDGSVDFDDAARR
ncbi:ribonuclease III [Luteitalea sp.]|uniref:ribonuclease III n=1 Tax=Luteitalea sp. TaxID=2004800 RepID=UPI0037C6979A